MESIIERFRNITVWKRGGERAPHKPLLALYAFGKLLNSKNRLIPYEEIDRELGELLREFGPKRSGYRTEYPFWRLQSDELWTVSGGERVKPNTSGDVRKSDLIRHAVSGGFPKHLFDKLRGDQRLVSDIIQDILDSNFPPSIHENILQSIGIDIHLEKVSRRKRHPEFRENVLKAYEYRCAVCGFDVKLGHYPIGLEAGHIKWHQAGGPDNEVNGLALCALHHKLFDRGAFTLSNRLEVLVSDRAYGTVGFKEWLMDFHGKKIDSPQRKTYYPDRKFTQWHVREVFQGEYREL
jgi:putative restriction endonuclease